MNRREYLALTTGSVTAVSGCLQHSMENPSSGVGESFPDVTVESDPTPDGRDVTVVVNRAFAASTPAELRIAYTNTGDSEREVGFTVSPPFPPYVGEATDGPGRLSLVPDDREYVDPHPRPSDADGDPFVPDTPTDGCWRAKAAVAGEDVGLTRTLEPGESVEGSYTLLAHPESDACLAAGDYRFEDPHYFGTDGPWGFTVSLRPA
jgi:hypothetical protein